MNLFAILVPPIIGAIIGYGTNCLAIRMLFRPHRAIYLFGWRLPFTPGLIPKEQGRLAKKMANTVGGRLITPEILARELVNSPLLVTGAAEVKAAIRKNLPQGAEFIRQFEHPRLDAEGPEFVKKLIQEHVGKLAGIFLDHNKIYASMKEGLAEYLSQEENLALVADKIDEGIDRILNDELKKAPVISALEKAAAHVTGHIDVKAIIEDQINSIQPEEAEMLILSVIRKELHIVMALGGVLGFIIGWVPVLFNLFG